MEVGTGAFDVDAVGAVHEFFESGHAGLHAGVIEGADAEVEVFEGFGAHAGLLCHGGGRPTEDNPFGFLDAPVLNGAHDFCGEVEFIGWHVGVFKNILRAAEANVGLHVFDALEFDLFAEEELRFGDAKHDFALNFADVSLDEWGGAAGADGADEFNGHGFGDVGGVDEDAVAFFKVGAEGGEEAGEFGVADVGDHGEILDIRFTRSEYKKT